MLTSLGRVWLAALLMLVFTPLINAYGMALDIPLLNFLTLPLAVTAILILFLSVPLSWGLGCAGLILEWLARHRSKRKRKLKRGAWSRTHDRSLLAGAGHRSTERHRTESRRARLDSTDRFSRRADDYGFEASGELGSLRGRN